MNAIEIRQAPESLLERAKAVKVKPQGRRSNMEPHDPEVALAWVSGELTTTQVAMAIGGSRPGGSNIYGWLAMSLKLAYQQEKLQIKR